MSTTTGNRFAPMTVDNHSGSLWIACILCLIYSILTLALRGHIKFRIYGMDDWFIAAGTAAQIGQVVALLIALDNGLGRPPKSSSLAQLITAGKAVFASQLLFILSMCLAKCSVLLLLMRLFNLDMRGSWKTSNRRFLYLGCLVLTGLVGVWGIASVAALSVDCSPPSFIQSSATTQCPDQLLRWRWITALDIATELVVVFLPFVIVWPVQISTSRKGQVVVAFVFRLGVPVAAAVHLHYVSDYLHAPHVSLSIIDALVWQQIELCVSSITATIPNLKAFVKSFNSGFGLENVATDGYGLGYGTNVSHNSQTRQAYQLDTVKSAKHNASRPSHDTKRVLSQRPFAENLRHDLVGHSTVIESGDARKRSGEGHSIGSANSQEMIIRKDVQYQVSYDGHN